MAVASVLQDWLTDPIYADRHIPKNANTPSRVRRTQISNQLHRRNQFPSVIFIIQLNHLK